ncbi:MAG TPA: UDP-N-acetylmuramoyl-tripeptide--D-alanyl-D-alanine ligase [Gammaproteobacteria bacterium]|nr:UDP-N-acetylmuramoyl-tripeptide--D-alanyl-D-alanine ligase [Gammaproteobacteria bacterium]
MMSLQQAAKATGGSVRGGGAYFTRVVTDSRGSVKDGLFVALPGPVFDGHRYAATAMKAGAVACMLEHQLQNVSPSLQVNDCRQALGRLAAHWRQHLPTRICAITGSNGKTTVKEMLTAILRKSASVTSTRGNQNNEIGLPLTLLRIRPEDRFAVVEMGMNHPGEIAMLSHWAAPNVAVITNAAAAHLAGLGDVTGVAAAKAEIFQGLAGDGIAIINADSPYAQYWQQQLRGHKVLRFGNAQAADVRAVEGTDARWQLRIGTNTATVTLQLPGDHNRDNALAAAAAAHALGIGIVDIAAGLENCQVVPGRLQLRATASGARLYDDSYNANPESLQAALQVLKKHSGRRILVLADMAELGPSSAVLHADCGRMAAEYGIDQLFALGVEVRNTCSAFAGAASVFDDVSSLLTALRPQLDADTVVLVKGSRCMHMEAVVAALCETAVTAGVASC